MGLHVDHDAEGEEGPSPLQADALPALRRRGATAGLRGHRAGRGAAGGDSDRAGGGGGRGHQGQS